MRFCGFYGICQRVSADGEGAESFEKKTVDVIYGGSLRQNNLLAEGIYFRQTLRLAAHAAFVVVNDMVCPYPTLIPTPRST